MPSFRISVMCSAQHFARSKSPVSHDFGHLGNLSFTISPSHACINWFIAFNPFPVIALASPSVERTDLLHASAIRLAIENENFSGTRFIDLEPLFGATEMPLPNSVIVAVNTDNLAVFKGNSSCPDSDHYPLTVSLVPPDWVVLRLNSEFMTWRKLLGLKFSAQLFGFDRGSGYFLPFVLFTFMLS